MGVVVGLEGFLPYFRRFGCGWSGAALVGLWAAESVVVVPEPCPGGPGPGDSGGVELVTGANTVSLLIITSHWPLVLNLGASSANKT